MTKYSGSTPGAGGDLPRQPFLIEPIFSPRIWGVRDLRSYYPERAVESEPIGESWLTGDQCRLPALGRTLAEVCQQHPEIALQPGEAAAFPFLIKFLFPADRLSVQVHPDDEYAARYGLGRGKTEMWYVIEARPEARLGVNLRPGTTKEMLAEACRHGRGAELLNWIPVEAGETIFLPAGTVHAIGPHMVLAEVQQQSDNTFRLDDYGRLDAQGRPRELHLEHGLAVARVEAGGGKHKTGVAKEESGLLVECPYFRTEKLQLRTGIELESTALHVLVPLQGEVLLRNVSGNEMRVPKAHAVLFPPGTGGWSAQGETAALWVSRGGKERR